MRGTQRTCRAASPMYRMRVVAPVAHLRVAAEFVPATGAYPGVANGVASAGQACEGGWSMCATHAEGAHGDERTAGKRHQRFKRRIGTGNHSGHSGRGTGYLQTGSVAGPPNRGQ